MRTQRGCTLGVERQAIAYAGKKAMYRPLDILSFSSCAVGPASSNDSHAARDSLAKPDSFSDSLLMTSSRKGQTVQLLQKSIRL